MDGMNRTPKITLISRLHDPSPVSSSSWKSGVGKHLLMKLNVDRIKSWAEFFVDLGGRKDVASVGGKHYPMIVKDDFTRCAWMYFLRSKSDAGSAFRSFLASVRADGIP